MYHHLEFKYLNPFYVHSFHAHLSRMHAPSCIYHSLFSSSPARSLHVSPILVNMVSRCLPCEVSHSPYHYTLHGFHHLSRLYYSLVSLGTYAFFFTATHTVSTRLSLCVSLYGILSHTLYVSRYESYH